MIYPDSPPQRKTSPLSMPSSPDCSSFLLHCVPSYITSPSATPFPPFHSLSPLFKCCTSWIPAVQSASTGEIEFTHNLVLILFICFICLLELWPLSSLLMSEMYSLYFLKFCINPKVGQSVYSKQALTENLSVKLKYFSWTGCLMDYRWVSTAHTRAGWHCICKYILWFCVSLLGYQLCVEDAK